MCVGVGGVRNFWLDVVNVCILFKIYKKYDMLLQFKKK